MATLSSSSGDEDDVGRVLSIQSHVVHGYVGNKSAVFPLQLLGFDVDFVNSVQFSNHTGYPSFTGDVLNGEQLEALVRGLDSNGLLSHVSHLLTGYIGSSSFLRAVCAVYRILKEKNSNIVFVCDPVLGDHGKLYVPSGAELVEVYRREMVPIATILTPNEFECEMLTGFKITSITDAVKSCLYLHEQGPEVVVITSMELQSEPEHIVMLASRRLVGRCNQGDDGLKAQHRYEIWRLSIPKIDGAYTGTGDLTAALFLAHLNYGRTSTNTMLEDDRQSDSLPSLPVAMANVVGSVTAIIKRTRAFSGHDPYGEEVLSAQGSGSSTDAPSRHGGQSLTAKEAKKPARGGELRLIQSKKDIERPDTSHFIPTPIPAEVVEEAIALLCEQKLHRSAR